MKKFLRIILACLLTLSLSGCSTADPSAEVKDGVSFKLLDALRVTNSTTNTVYYYFLASLQNDSSESYSLDELSYKITDQDNVDINAIDRSEFTVSKSVRAGESTFVYGYVGYPNNNQKDMGILFPKNGAFIPFSSVKVRNISDKNVNYSSSQKFTLFSDKYFQFDVNAEDCEYVYENGNSVVKGLQITYTNKTNDRLVVPYITPVATIKGIRLSDYAGRGDFANMSEEEIRKFDFNTNDMAPKLDTYTGTATGYECFYLTAEQSLTCTIDFTFEGIIPEFANYNPQAISIVLNSAALGYSQTVYIPY